MFPAPAPAPLLRVYITACNIKKLDLKFYGIEKCRCWVTVTLGEQTYSTQIGIGLDPEWEEETFMTIGDIENDKVEAVFYVKDATTEVVQQLGDKQYFGVSKLLKGKATFKGLVVPGGKADMMFTAMNFGNDEPPDEDDAFMDFL